jgi:hypothetical protein
VREGVVHGYSLLVLGVYFRFFFGPNVPDEFQRFCCVHSNRVIVADLREQSLHSYGHLSRTAKESAGLKDALQQHGNYPIGT